jgi:hypothetical protein
MTNLRKNLLVAGCACLSFTLFSFTSKDVTQSKIGDVSISYQTESTSSVAINSTAKTLKLVAKVWRNSCQVAAYEFADWLMGDVTNNTPDSEQASKEMNYKLNQL